MTREEALKNLNLPESAGKEEIEKAYQRMVRRYPPEFHPERFRQIDESYRTLTSLPFLLENLLSPTLKQAELDPALFSFSPSLSDDCLENAMSEIRKAFLMDYLWAIPPAPEKKVKPGQKR